METTLRFTMNDNSMDNNTPQGFCEGDILELDPTPASLKAQEQAICVVFSNNTGETTCRVVQKVDAGLVLAPLNPAFEMDYIENAETVTLKRVRAFVRAY